MAFIARTALCLIAAAALAHAQNATLAPVVNATLPPPPTLGTSVLVQQLALSAVNATAGFSIALLPTTTPGTDYVFIGAPSYTNGNVTSGAVLLALCSGLYSENVTCSELPVVITGSNATSGDYFGCSLALDGTNLLVGACMANNAQGKAYLFDCSNPSNCSQLAVILAPTTQTNLYFGDTLAFSNGKAVISNFFPAFADDAIAYVFDCTNAAVNHHCLLLRGLSGSNLATNSNFNDLYNPTEISDNSYYIAGADGQDAVYIWNLNEINNCTWVDDGAFPVCNEDVLILSDLAGFGADVRYTSGILAVSADRANGGMGAIVLYSCPQLDSCGSSSDISTTIAPITGNTGDNFGASFDIVADSEGAALVIGAPGAAQGNGSVSLYTCSGTPPTLTFCELVTSYNGTTPNSAFGAVVVIEKTNGDYVLIGSQSLEGGVFVLSDPLVQPYVPTVPPTTPPPPTPTNAGQSSPAGGVSDATRTFSTLLSIALSAVAVAFLAL